MIACYEYAAVVRCELNIVTDMAPGLKALSCGLMARSC